MENLNNESLDELRGKLENKEKALADVSEWLVRTPATDSSYSKVQGDKAEFIKDIELLNKAIDLVLKFGKLGETAKDAATVIKPLARSLSEMKE